MPNIGPTELIVILVIALLVLGPKKLPEVGKSLGRGIREFKDGVTSSNDDRDHHAEAPPATPRINAAPTPVEQPTASTSATTVDQDH